MTRTKTPRWLVSAAAGLSLAVTSASALGQATPLPESIAVGEWTFRPLVEVRLRAEYRRHPFDVGGDVYGPASILAEDYQSALPKLVEKQPPVKNQYFVLERSRLGLAVDRGPVTAAITLQDARVWGDTGAALVGPGERALPAFGPYEAYIDVHTRSGRKVFFRLGRQAVTWGDGRLVGANDWSATGRSLDAARIGFSIGDVDVQLMAVMLATPGRYDDPTKPASTSGERALLEGSGTQLYGLNAVWNALPLLHVELTGLARVARQPVPATLVPSNVFVIDGRVSGDRRGFRYAVEGAYERGQVQGFGQNRDLEAFAFAARASWETSLPGHLTFGAEGAYASGDDGSTSGKITRFDPILPDEHTWLSPMSLFAWSNLIFGGATLSAKPIEELTLTAGYRYAALAKAGGRWSDAALQPIGVAPSSNSRSLGHEIDGAIKITPWKPLEIELGYGLFLRGLGAREILFAVEKPATLQHWAYLQTTVRAP